MYSTTSNIAIVPATWMPAYSSSKAALGAFILCLRDQLRKTEVKVIEVSPPAVQCEFVHIHFIVVLLLSSSSIRLKI